MDKHRGQDFPAAKLHSFKAFHEARAAREQSGISAPEFWFHELQITNSPGFSTRETLRFGKVTVVVGNNGIGKTAICDWLAGLTGDGCIQRWTRNTEVDVSARYFAPDDTQARMRIAGDGRVSYFSNSIKVPFYANPIQLIRLPQGHYSLNDEFGDVERISQVLSIDINMTQNLIEFIAEQNEGRIEDPRIELDDETGLSVLTTFNRKRKKHIAFCAMSDSERQRLLIEICVARARFTSRFLPTLLLLDGVHSLDHRAFQDFMDFMLSSDNHFQTLVTRILPPKTSGFDWAGWEFATLRGHWGNVTIDQSPF